MICIEKPVVSVIINCLNGEEFLSEAIESVLNQSYENWEIILWDNASTQNIRAKVEKFSDERIKYFRGDETVLLGEARNLAVSKSQGEFLAFLDSDDLWSPDKLKLQLKLFRDPEVALVYSDCECFNKSGVRKRYSKSKNFIRGRCFGELLADYHLVLSSVIVRRAVLVERCIEFNKHYNMIEEADVFLRIAYYSKIDYCPQLLAAWRVHQNSLTWRKFHLLADETDLMLHDFSEKWPDVEVMYSSEFLAKRIWIVRQRVVGLCMQGKQAEARACLLDAKKILPLKVLALYPLTFFNPKKWIPFAYRFFGSVVTP